MNGVRYRRSVDGTTVHLADCPRATTAVPWNYADDMDADALLSEMAQYRWLKPCGVCKPLAVRA